MIETCILCGKEIKYEVEKNQSIVTYCTKCSSNGKWHQTIREIKNERDALRISHAALLEAAKAVLEEHGRTLLLGYKSLKMIEEAIQKAEAKP